MSPLLLPRPPPPPPIMQPPLPLLLPPLLLSLPPPLVPLIGDGLSSFDFRFSGRGGRNAVGDVDGVFPPAAAPFEPAFDEPPDAFVAVAELDDVDAVIEPLLPPEMDDVDVDAVFVVDVADVVVVRPPRPFAPPFRNLL